jgi:hypothetical protein
LLPAILVVLGTKRFLFAVADSVDAVAAHSCRYHSFLDRVGAAVPKSQVVLNRSPLVAIPFDGERDVGMLRQELGIALGGGPLISPNVELVEVKEDIVDILSEELFVT